MRRNEVTAERSGGKKKKIRSSREPMLRNELATTLNVTSAVGSTSPDPKNAEGIRKNCGNQVIHDRFGGAREFSQ
jgi:hypothetical protein